MVTFPKIYENATKKKAVFVAKQVIDKPIRKVIRYRQRFSKANTTEIVPKITTVRKYTA